MRLRYARGRHSSNATIATPTGTRIPKSPEESKVLRLGLLSEIADSWSTLITHGVFEDNRASI
jgi:hypothetical protein